MLADLSGTNPVNYRVADRKEFTPTLFPATGEFGQTHCISRMPLSPGDKPGPYEILERVGVGGKGGFDARWWIPG